MLYETFVNCMVTQPRTKTLPTVRMYLLRYVLLFTAGGYAATAAINHEFEVHGEMTCRLGGGLLRRRDDVVFSKRGCCWNLKIVEREAVYDGTAMPPGTEYVEASYDGTNIYLVTMVGSKAAGKPACNAVIESGVVPYDLDPRIGNLWLAFGSSCYFQSVSNNLILPIEGFGLYKTNFSRDYRVRGRWELNPDIGLPSLVEYYATCATGRGVGEILITNLTYEVAGATNTAGGSFPSGFHIKKFRCKEGRLVAYEECDFKVLSLASKTAVECFTQRLPMRSTIEDKRFYKFEPPKYDVTFFSTNWPDLHKALVLRPGLTETPRPGNRARHVLIGFLLVSTAPVVLYLLLRTVKRRKERNLIK